MIRRLFKLALQAPQILRAATEARKMIAIHGFDPFNRSWAYAKALIWMHVMHGDEIAKWTAYDPTVPFSNPTMEHVTTVPGLIAWAFEDPEKRRGRLLPIYQRLALEKRQAEWRAQRLHGIRVHKRNGELVRVDLGRAKPRQARDSEGPA